MFFFLVVAKFLLFITPFFDTSVRSLAGEPNFSLKAARSLVCKTGLVSRRLTRLKSWDKMCHVKSWQTHIFFSKTNFRIGTEHLILFGRQVFTDVSWFSKFMALLNYLCVFRISLAVQCRTPLEIRQKHSRILLYMHRFRIVSLVNSLVARLMCLPPTFRFVRLGVQRENHCDG